MSSAPESPTTWPTPEAVLWEAGFYSVPVYRGAEGNAGNPNFQGLRLLAGSVELNTGEDSTQPDDPAEDDGTTIQRGLE